MAAPTFVGAGAPVITIASDGAVVVALPAGLAEDDVIVLHVYCRSSATLTAPAGYTELTNLNNGSTLRHAIFWKVAGASESNPTVAFGGTNQLRTGYAFAFRGCDLVGGPIGTLGTSSSNAAAQEIGPISGLSLEDDGMVLVAGARPDQWGTAPPTLSGDGLTWARAGEINTETGGDGAQVLDYAPNETGAPVTITSKTFAAVSPVAQVSIGIMLTLLGIADPDPPTDLDGGELVLTSAQRTTVEVPARATAALTAGAPTTVLTR